MIKKVLFISLFMFVFSCKKHKQKELVKLELTLKIENISENPYLLGASQIKFFDKQKNNISMISELPRGFYNFFGDSIYLSRDTKWDLDFTKKENFYLSLDKENEVFYKINQIWNKKISNLYKSMFENSLAAPDNFLNELQELIKKTDELLLEKNLDLDFVRFQKENFRYAAKYAALLYVRNYGNKWDHKTGDIVPNGKKLTVEEQKKLEFFIEEKMILEDEDLFRNATFYRSFIELRKNFYDNFPTESTDNYFLAEFQSTDRFFKSELIKEFFWFEAVKNYFNYGSNSKYDKVNYDTYMSRATNKSFKEHIEKLYKEISKLAKGAKTPGFNYENQDGEKISLESLKGSYVYLDLWATWCGPCLIQFPYLKQLKKTYKDRPIKFVGISLDDPKDKEKWKEFLKKEALEGIQLLADKDFKSDFARFFNITGIPRFILLDKQGRIIEKNAPNPSSKEIHKLLNSLDL